MAYGELACGEGLFCVSRALWFPCFGNHHMPSSFRPKKWGKCRCILLHFIAILHFWGLNFRGTPHLPSPPPAIPRPPVPSCETSRALCPISNGSANEATPRGTPPSFPARSGRPTTGAGPSLKRVFSAPATPVVGPSPSRGPRLFTFPPPSGQDIDQLPKRSLFTPVVWAPRHSLRVVLG